MKTLRRVVALLLGDMTAAEDIGELADVPRVAWIDQAGARNRLEVAKYAVEASRRSAENARAAVDGIQDRAASLLTLLVGLAPLFIAAVALAASRDETSPWRCFALIAFVVASGTLVSSMLLAALATGLTLGGGLNLSRVVHDTPTPSLARLHAGEADAWHHAASLAWESGRRKASDLFHARQMLMWTVVLALVGTIMLVSSVGGDVGQLITPQSSGSGTAIPSPAPESSGP